jgi:hypothetical protein
MSTGSKPPGLRIVAGTEASTKLPTVQASVPPGQSAVIKDCVIYAQSMARF